VIAKIQIVLQLQIQFVPVQASQKFIARIVWVSAFGEVLPNSRESFDYDVFCVAGGEQRTDKVDPDYVLKVVGMVNAVGESSRVTEKAESSHVSELVVKDVGEGSD
jgi:hypothetical protein